MLEFKRAAVYRALSWFRSFRSYKQLLLRRSTFLIRDHFLNFKNCFPNYTEIGANSISFFKKRKFYEIRPYVSKYKLKRKLVPARISKKIIRGFGHIRYPNFKKKKYKFWYPEKNRTFDTYSMLGLLRLTEFYNMTDKYYLKFVGRYKKKKIMKIRSLTCSK